MKIAVLTTGDEVMAGNIIDTNSAWISDKCWMLGHDVVLQIAVGDDQDDIIDAMSIAFSKADAVVVTGGLGATVDDLTLDAAAKYFDREMVFHEDIWSEIKGFFDQVGRECSGNNKRQAYMPAGAVALVNRVGTAPGVRVSYNGKEFFFLPGVPKEMKQIFSDSISPWLQESSSTPGYYQKFLKCFGLPEATFDEMIKDIDLGDVKLSFRVSFPEVKIKLISRSDNIESSKEKVLSIAEKIREKLGYFVYGEDEETLEEMVGKCLINKKYRVSTAESCTGGLIASRITDIPGASNYFDLGIQTYSNKSKVEKLGVAKEIIEEFGAVSSQCALAMAEGVRRVSGSDIGLSVTGIAGPTGGTDEKPVGTVHIAIVGPSGAVHKHFIYARDRKSFKDIVATTALDMLRRYLVG